MYIKQLTKLWIFAFVVLASTESFSQDPEFTQFYANPLYLNPAMAGTKNCPRISLNFRDQWPALSASYVTGAASYDQKVNALHGGIGITALYDDAGHGILSTFRIGGVYSYHLKINRRLSINFGVQADFMQKHVDWDKLKFGDMIDPRSGFIYTTAEQEREPTVNTADFHAGLLLYSSKKWFVGFAAHHINQPRESLIGDPRGAKLPIKLTLHGGAEFVLENSKKYKNPLSVSPNVMIRYQGRIGKVETGGNSVNTISPNQYQQYLLGLYVNKGVFTGGLWYRVGDAIIVSVGIRTKHFNFGYSYDMTASKVEITSGGSHEVSMTFNFPCKSKKRKFRALSCPSF